MDTALRASIIPQPRTREERMGRTRERTRSPLKAEHVVKVNANFAALIRASAIKESYKE